MAAETPVIENFVEYPFPLSITLFFVIVRPSKYNTDVNTGKYAFAYHENVIGGWDAMRAGD